LSFRLTREVAAGNPTIVALPDVGLVGVIAASFMISSSRSVVVGSIELEDQPPIAVIHEGRVLDPIRIYEVRNEQGPSFNAVYSDIPVPPMLAWQISEAIMDFAGSVGSKELLVLGGLPEPNRINIDKPRVFVVSSDPEYTASVAQRAEAEVFETGYVTGPNAALLKLGRERGIKVLLVLAQSHLNYPDPGASAEVIAFVNKVYGTSYNVQPLIEQAESIRLQLRDLMRRTAASLSRGPKGLELEAPPGYIR
jgi:uncharacterized protein